MSVYQLSARELYDAYAKGRQPEAIIDEGRTALATQLRVEEGLSEKDAFFAADQLMVHAQELLDRQEAQVQS